MRFENAEGKRTDNRPYLFFFFFLCFRGESLIYTLGMLGLKIKMRRSYTLNRLPAFRNDVNLFIFSDILSALFFISFKEFIYNGL